MLSAEKGHELFNRSDPRNCKGHSLFCATFHDPYLNPSCFLSISSGRRKVVAEEKWEERWIQWSQNKPLLRL
jgi:hypothetical protein